MFHLKRIGCCLKEENRNLPCGAMEEINSTKSTTEKDEWRKWVNPKSYVSSTVIVSHQNEHA